MGYAGYGGIWSLLEQQGITANVLIDRDGGAWVDSNSDGICDPDLEVVWHNAGTDPARPVTGPAGRPIREPLAGRSASLLKLIPPRKSISA